MTSNRDNDALSWGGDSDPTLVPGSVGPELSDGWSAPHTKEPVEAIDAVETRPEPTAGVGPDVAGSAALVFMGILAGVYLLYTIGWFIGAGRVGVPVSADPLATFMFSFGTWLAVAAPVIWFATAFWLTKNRPGTRLTWLIIGVVALAPLPLLLGVNA